MPGIRRDLGVSENYRDAVHFGSVDIRFAVEFRKRKHIGITVRPDLQIVVAAPHGLSESEVRSRVRRRSPWILRQLGRFERFKPTPTSRQYLSGETHRYLGRQYRLKITKGENSGVRLHGRYFHVVTTKAGDRGLIRKLVEEWFRSHARETFERRLQHCLDELRGFCSLQPALQVRRMHRRWGSCTKTGRILLNVELVQAPIDCIDYVIVHELCHLEVPDHSPEFFRLLSRHMPDWKRRKARLESVGL